MPALQDIVAQSAQLAKQGAVAAVPVLKDLCALVQQGTQSLAPLLGASISAFTLYASELYYSIVPGTAAALQLYCESPGAAAVAVYAPYFLAALTGGLLARL
jgi:hypothetical protein